MGVFGGGSPELTIPVSMNVSSAVGDADKLKHSIDGLGHSVDSVSKHGASMGGVLSGLTSPIRGLVSGLGAIGLASVGITAVTSAVKGLLDGMLGGNAQMESYATQFEVLTGSMANAGKLMGDLKTMGAKTPFEFPGLAASTQTLLAFGVAQRDIIPTLSMLGDISGGNAEKLKGLSLVFGQVASNGKLMGQDLLQMINQGFNPLKVISEQTGQSMTALREDMSKGLITFDMVNSAFKTATSEGGQFFGMMEKQSHTFTGMMSNLADNFGSAQRALFEGVFQQAKGVLEWLTSGEVTAGLQAFATQAGQVLGQAATTAVQFITQVGPQIVAAFQTIWTTVSPVLGQITGWFISMLPGAIAIGVAVFNGVLVPAFQTISTAINQYVIPAFLLVGDWLGKHLPPLIGVLATAWQNLQPVILTVAKFLSEDVVPALLKVGSIIMTAVMPVLGFLSKHMGEVAIAITTLLVPAFTAWAIGAASAAISTIAAFAPVVVAFGGIMAAVLLLKHAWENNFLGIRDIAQSVGQALGGVFDGIVKAVKWLADRVAEATGWIAKSFGWLKNEAETHGTETGQKYTGNLNGAIITGIPYINKNIQGVGKNLGALRGPAGVIGSQIGGGWITAINQSIVDGIATLASNINAVKQILSFAGTPDLTIDQKVRVKQLGLAAGVDLPAGLEGDLDATFKAIQAGMQEKVNSWDIQKMFKSAVNSTLGGVSNIGLDLFKGDSGPPIGGGPTGGKGGGGGPGGGGAGAGAGGSKSVVQSAIEAAADMTSKISSAVNQGIEALGKLGNFTLPARFTEGIDQFAIGVNAVMMRMQAVAIQFGAEMLQHTGLFLDTASKGMGVVSSGVDALTKLKDFVKPADGAVDSFVDSLQYVINKLGDIASKWAVDSIAILGMFSDSTTKAMSMVSVAIDSLMKLKDFQKPSDVAMQSFVDALDYLTDKLRRVIAKWDINALSLAASFGEHTGKMVEGIGKTVDTLSKLVDFKRPMDDAINSFFDAIDAIVPKVSDRARQWYGLINEGIADLAGFVGNAVTGMFGAVDGMVKLAGPGGAGVQMPNVAGIELFFNALDLIAPKISERAIRWYGLMNQSSSEVAEYVGKAVTGVLGAIDGLLKLASPSFQVPTDLSINLFFDALDKIVPLINERMRQWYGLMNQSSSELATQVGSAVTGILGAVEGILKLADFKGIAPEAIESFFAALWNVFDQARKAMEGLPADLVTKAGALGVAAASMSEAVQSLLGLASADVTSERDGWIGLWRSAGVDALGGLTEGFKDSTALEGLKEAARQAMRDALDAAKAEAGIASPSKVAAREIGMPFIAGMAMGARKASGMFSSAVAGVVGGALGFGYDSHAYNRALAPAGVGGMGTVNLTIPVYVNGRYESTEKVSVDLQNRRELKTPRGRRG